MAGPFFENAFFDGGFFGAVIQPSSIYYGVGHPVYWPKRKKKKYDNAVLFADIEQSLRTLVYGTAVSDDMAPAATVRETMVVADVPTALAELARLAEGRRNLQQRLKAIRADLDALRADALRLAEEEDVMLVLF